MYSPRIEGYLRKAEECDAKASQVKDADARQTLRAAAEQWRELARQVHEWERVGTARIARRSIRRFWTHHSTLR